MYQNMKRMMKIFFLIIILLFIFNILNVTSEYDHKKIISKNPIGSPGPFIARFLEFYARLSGRYYEQEKIIILCHFNFIHWVVICITCWSEDV